MSTNINKRIKEVRETLGMSQQDFANEIGVSRGLITKSEGDNFPVSQQLLVKISKRFPEINISYIVNGTGSIKVNNGVEFSNNKVNRDANVAIPTNTYEPEFVTRLVKENEALYEQLKKKDEQIEKLLGLLTK